MHYYCTTTPRNTTLKCLIIYLRDSFKPSTWVSNPSLIERKSRESSSLKWFRSRRRVVEREIQQADFSSPADISPVSLTQPRIPTIYRTFRGYNFSGILILMSCGRWRSWIIPRTESRCKISSSRRWILVPRSRMYRIFFLHSSYFGLSISQFGLFRPPSSELIHLPRPCRTRRYRLWTNGRNWWTST